MPRTNREKTAYPGVFVNTDSKGCRTFSIRYRRDNSRKQIEEVVGKSSHGMTAAKANRIRSQRIAGKDEANLPTVETPHLQLSEPDWTLISLWDAYLAANPSDNKNRACDISVFNIYLRKPFGNKSVAEITTADIDAFRNRLLRRKLAPATVCKPLELMRRLFNYGDRQGYIVLPRTLHFNLPRVDNQKTEVLTDEQLRRFVAALDEYENENSSLEKDFFVAYGKLVLHTGIRRRAAVALKWDDIDFDRGFITLRGDTAKSGKTKSIPMSNTVRDLLLSLEHSHGEFVFPQHDVSTYSKYMRKVCNLAGLPKDFRPIHGLRHNFASRVASSGKVDLYTLQNMLTHSSPEMTQRYAHLADKAMHKAAQVADDVLSVNEGH